MVNKSDPDFGADNVHPKKTHDVVTILNNKAKKMSFLFVYWAPSLS